MNAVDVLVAETVTSRGYWLRQVIEAAYDRAQDGMEPDDMTYIGATRWIDGLSLYVDDEGDIWVGSDEYVYLLDENLE